MSAVIKVTWLVLVLGMAIGLAATARARAANRKAEKILEEFDEIKLPVYDAKKAQDQTIEWPQYYQGNYWDSELSKGWGITAIPRVFVVDQDGKLYSVTARGKLDTIIPELLKQRSAAKEEKRIRSGSQGFSAMNPEA